LFKCLKNGISIAPSIGTGAKPPESPSPYLRADSAFATTTTIIIVIIIRSAAYHLRAIVPVDGSSEKSNLLTIAGRRISRRGAAENRRDKRINTIAALHGATPPQPDRHGPKLPPGELARLRQFWVITRNNL